MVSLGVMVEFAFIVKGMSVTPKPVLWSRIDLKVEGPSWSGAVRDREAILLPHVVGYLQAHPDMTLQHDNATSHTARFVRVLPWPMKNPRRVRGRAIPPRNVWELAGGRVG